MKRITTLALVFGLAIGAFAAPAPQATATSGSKTTKKKMAVKPASDVSTQLGEMKQAIDSQQQQIRQLMQQLQSRDTAIQQLQQQVKQVQSAATDAQQKADTAASQSTQQQQNVAAVK